MSALVQYDDRNINVFRPLILKNQEYCKTHNIQYIFIEKGYEDYPPWWRKVFIIRDLLSSYDSILWVDSDACIVGKTHFKNLFNEKHFVMSPNPPPLKINILSFLSASFCAGVWAVKNSLQGISIINSWCKCYDLTLWKKENNLWISTGEYGGHAYEQGSFQIQILKKYKKFIEQKQYWILNHLPQYPEFYNKTDTFAVHFWKNNSNFIQEWIKNTE